MPRHPVTPPLTSQQQQLVTAHAHIIVWATRRFRCKCDDALETAHDAATLGLIAAARCYRPGRVPFGAYAWICINRRVGREMYLAAQKSIPWHPTLDITLSSEPYERDPLDDVVATEQVQEVEKALSALPERQRHMIRLWRRDYTMDTIADIYGVSLSRIQQIVRDGLQKIQAAVLEETQGPDCKQEL